MIYNVSVSGSASAMTLLMLLVTGCRSQYIYPDPVTSPTAEIPSDINRSPLQRIAITGGILTIDRCLDAPPAHQKEQRKQGKITSVFWVEGEQRLPVHEITHVGDVGLIINTQGYQLGTCVEAMIDAEDGSDLIDGHRQLRLWGKVDSRGEVVLPYIFNELPSPLIIVSGDDQQPGRVPRSSTTKAGQFAPNQHKTQPISTSTRR